MNEIIELVWILATDHVADLHCMIESSYTHALMIVNWSDVHE